MELTKATGNASGDHHGSRRGRVTEVTGYSRSFGVVTTTVTEVLEVTGNTIKAPEATTEAANEGRGAHGSYGKFNLVREGCH